MKNKANIYKLAIVIFFISIILFPDNAFATVIGYKTHILFTYGLSPLKAYVEGYGEGAGTQVVIIGDDVSQILVKNRESVIGPDGKLRIRHPFPKMNGYKFWNIRGENAGDNFFILGYTSEVGGDTFLERNGILFHVIPLFFAFLLVYFIIGHILKRKKLMKQLHIIQIVILSIIFIVVGLLTYRYFNNQPTLYSREGYLFSSTPTSHSQKVDVKIRKGNLWYGDVYFVNKENEETLVAASKSVENGSVDSYFDSIFYIDAFLSPDEKRIAVVGKCWEDDCTWVYDIDTHELHQTTVASQEVEWLEDGRLKIQGACDRPTDLCGIYESQDNLKPWILKEVVEQEKIIEKTTEEKTILTLHRGSFGYEEKEMFVELKRPTPEDLSWGSVEYLYVPKEEEFRLFVQVNMPDDLEDVEFYNGWLTDGMKTKYINTGKFSENTTYGEKFYQNAFVTNTDYSDYQVYIISREKGSADETPYMEMISVVVLKVQ